MGRICVTVGLLVMSVPALAAATQTAPAVVQAQAVSEDYSFRSPTALLVFHVRPDRAADFEAIVGRLALGLDGAVDPLRRLQRSGWRFFRSADAPATAAIFVLIIDPVVPGSDYDPVRMLTELLPAESVTLYERLKAAVIKIERMGLTMVK